MAKIHKLAFFITLTAFFIFLSLIFSYSSEYMTRSKFENMVNNSEFIDLYPVEKYHNSKLTQELLTVFKNHASWIGDREVIHLVLQQKNWHISRDEFTALIKLKYVYADIILKSDNPEEYLIVNVMFYRKNKLLGIFYDDIMIWERLISVYRVRK